MITLPERLRELRGERPLKAISEITGLSVSYLSDLEHERAIPPLPTLVKLADYYGIRVVDILAPVDLGESAQQRVIPFEVLEP